MWCMGRLPQHEVSFRLHWRQNMHLTNCSSVALELGGNVNASQVTTLRFPAVLGFQARISWGFPSKLLKAHFRGSENGQPRICPFRSWLGNWRLCKASWSRQIGTRHPETPCSLARHTSESCKRRTRPHATEARSGTS